MVAPEPYQLSECTPNLPINICQLKISPPGKKKEILY